VKQVAVRRVQMAQANRAQCEVTRSGHSRSPSGVRFLCAYNDYAPVTEPVSIYCPQLQTSPMISSDEGALLGRFSPSPAGASNRFKS
jgi:hypothetical protein